MYEAFFGLRDLPFRDIPDPSVVFNTPAFSAAADALQHAIAQRRGLLTLAGAPGTGKTLLVRHLVASQASARLRFAVLPHPGVSADELVEFLGGAMGLAWRGVRGGARRDELRAALAAEADAGRNVVLVVDEAQALPPPTLRALAPLLRDCARGSAHTVQVLLAGQPPLAALLREADLAGTGADTVHLAPLARDEVADYVHTRLHAAGAPHDAGLFTPRALALVARWSEGVPRLVNVLCDGSLAAAFAAGARQVGADLVRRFWQEYRQMHRAAWPPVPVETAPPPTPPPARPAPPAPEPPSSRPAPSSRPEARALPPVRASGTVLPPPTGHVPSREPAAGRGARRAAAALVLLAAALSAVSVLRRPADPPAPPVPRRLGPENIATARRAPAAAVPGTPQGARPSPADALAAVDEFRREWESRHQASFLQPSAEITPAGAQVIIRAPFMLRFRDTAGAAHEQHGTATWVVAQVAGRPRIVVAPPDLSRP